MEVISRLLQVKMSPVICLQPPARDRRMHVGWRLVCAGT
jgi:hypothetical protein